MGKIIQITTVTADSNSAEGSLIFALCDDGSILYKNAFNLEAVWHKESLNCEDDE